MLGAFSEVEGPIGGEIILRNEEHYNSSSSPNIRLVNVIKLEKLDERVMLHSCVQFQVHKLFLV